jgi:two-component system, chemotaxis family, chemotaxis protein CheY
VQLLFLNSSAPLNGTSVKLGKRSTHEGAGSTALVVDDNAIIRKILADAFLSSGFETCGEAENGQEGIEVAKQINPDVITLDLSMPVMNGLEAASRLRKIFPKTPIILFTLYADSLSQRDAAKAGVDLVVLKTMPVSTLIEKAMELMGNET